MPKTLAGSETLSDDICPGQLYLCSPINPLSAFSLPVRHYKEPFPWFCVDLFSVRHCRELDGIAINSK